VLSTLTVTWLGLADQVEVLDPPELRNRIASSARSVAALY
jgi:hypothetical protein